MILSRQTYKIRRTYEFICKYEFIFPFSIIKKRQTWKYLHRTMKSYINMNSYVRSLKIIKRQQWTSINGHMNSYAAMSSYDFDRVNRDKYEDGHMNSYVDNRKRF